MQWIPTLLLPSSICYMTCKVFSSLETIPTSSDRKALSSANKKMKSYTSRQGMKNKASLTMACFEISKSWCTSPRACNPISTWACPSATTTEELVCLRHGTTLLLEIGGTHMESWHVHMSGRPCACCHHSVFLHGSMCSLAMFSCMLIATTRGMGRFINIHGFLLGTIQGQCKINPPSPP